MRVLLKQGNIPEADHAGFKADGIIELFAQSITQRKNTGFGIESQTQAKAKRNIVNIASRRFLFIPSGIEKGVYV